MKRKYLLLCLYIVLFILLNNKLSYSQVGIGATQFTPDASSMLEIKAANKGLLIPRVSLTSINDVTTIPSPATSLIVYNTNASMTGGSVGFYYYNGTIWVMLGSGSLTNSHIFVGNASNAATDVAMTGDVTIDNTGATTVSKINNTSLAGLATGLLKNTTGTGIPSIAIAGTDFMEPSSSFNLGTTSIPLNRVSAPQSLTGITSIDGSAAKWSTARSLAGNSVDGSSDVAFVNNFIVQGTSDAGLSGAQFLGSLSNGLLKNTTTTGVLSIATEGIDYEYPLTFSNGLTRSTNAITWGGTLTGATSIDNSTYALTLGGSSATGTITLGSSIGTGQTVNIGSGNTTGTDIINIGTGTATTAKNVNIQTTAPGTTTIGNTNGTTALNLKAGTGNLTVTTPTSVFQTNTATDDQIQLTPSTGGAAKYAGTVTSNDLTAARTWTFPDAAGTIPLILNKNVNQVTVNSSNAETAVYTYTVPAGILGTTGGVRITLYGTYLNSSGAASSLTVRVRYGGIAGTIVAQTGAFSNANSAAIKSACIEAVINNLTVNSQTSILNTFISTTTSPPAGTNTFTITSRTTAAAATGASFDLVVTVQHSVNNANTTFTKEIAILELLP
ncbi:MAG TPA: hypothetical protein PKK00_12050 [Bacteroidales bacterium]|nr:hypothetical protein [Bacteroidales bacterium]HPS17530.1 hypothetical protein [Bacteroidales bacterium]